MLVYENADTENFGTAVDLNEFDRLAVVEPPANFDGLWNEEDGEISTEEIVSVDRAENFLRDLSLGAEGNYLLLGEYNSGEWVEIVPHNPEE